MAEENKTEVGGIDSNQLNSYFDRIERMEEEIKAMRADLREIFNEAQAICLTLCSVTREIILMLMSCSRGLKKNMMRFIYLPILLPEDILL